MRVLVIEDDAGLRAQLVENLKEAGNVVDAAADGEKLVDETCGLAAVFWR